MNRLRYKVTLLAPVIISSADADENMTGTNQSIPGSVLLGTFAARYLEKKPAANGHMDPVFYQWFLGEGLFFVPAFPLIRDDYQDFLLYPLPFSLRKSKQPKSKEGYDFLAVDSKFDRSFTSSCSGYGAIDGSRIMKGEVETKLYAHHERDRNAGTVRKGIFFYYEALQPGQEFYGEIRGEAREVEEFRQFFGSGFEARMGKSKNAEYGRVRIELEQPESWTRDTDLGDSINITFISPCILWNDYGYGVPSRERLEVYLEDFLGVENLKISRAYLKETTMENYLAVWRMKRPAEKALAPGSTCRLEISGFNEAVQERLARLAYTGLGERRKEGFGQLRINWLIQDNSEYEFKDIKGRYDAGADVPRLPLSETAREIFREVFWFHLNLRVKEEALMDYKNYHHLPVNSLLGRLLLTLEKSETRVNFVENIAEWNGKKAYTSLSNCVNGRENLNLGEALTNNKKLLKIIQTLREEFDREVPVEVAEVLQNGWARLGVDGGDFYRMYRLYWRSVFQEMRRLNKQAEQAQGEGRDDAAGKKANG